jgi:hypothetical protein
LSKLLRENDRNIYNVLAHVIQMLQTLRIVDIYFPSRPSNAKIQYLPLQYFMVLQICMNSFFPYIFPHWPSMEFTHKFYYYFRTLNTELGSEKNCSLAVPSSTYRSYSRDKELEGLIFQRPPNLSALCLPSLQPIKCHLLSTFTTEIRNLTFQ